MKCSIFAFQHNRVVISPLFLLASNWQHLIVKLVLIFQCISGLYTH